MGTPRASFSPTEHPLSVSFPETRKGNGCRPLDRLPVFASIPPPAEATLTLSPSGRSEEEDPVSQGPFRGLVHTGTGWQGARPESRSPFHVAEPRGSDRGESGKRGRPGGRCRVRRVGPGPAGPGKRQVGGLRPSGAPVSRATGQPAARRRLGDRPAPPRTPGPAAASRAYLAGEVQLRLAVERLAVLAAVRVEAAVESGRNRGGPGRPRRAWLRGEHRGRHRRVHRGATPLRRHL